MRTWFVFCPNHVGSASPAHTIVSHSFTVSPSTSQLNIAIIVQIVVFFIYNIYFYTFCRLRLIWLHLLAFGRIFNYLISPCFRFVRRFPSFRRRHRPLLLPGPSFTAIVCFCTLISIFLLNYVFGALSLWKLRKTMWPDVARCQHLVWCHFDFSRPASHMFSSCVCVFSPLVRRCTLLPVRHNRICKHDNLITFFCFFFQLVIYILIVCHLFFFCLSSVNFRRHKLVWLCRPRCHSRHYLFRQTLFASHNKRCVATRFSFSSTFFLTKSFTRFSLSAQPFLRLILFSAWKWVTFLHPFFNLLFFLFFWFRNLNVTTTILPNCHFRPFCTP